jgi:uncharacterized membrane protein YkvA (DUF1232 family)
MDKKLWRERAKELRSEVHALYLAYKDPRTPWYAKGFAALVLGYALSPIDLIPDFIPILGYVDDLVIIPAGIALLLKMIPKEILEECRERARAYPGGKVKNWVAGTIIILIWIVALGITLKLFWRVLAKLLPIF